MAPTPYSQFSIKAPTFHWVHQLHLAGLLLLLLIHAQQALTVSDDQASSLRVRACFASLSVLQRGVWLRPALSLPRSFRLPSSSALRTSLCPYISNDFVSHPLTPTPTPTPTTRGQTRTLACTHMHAHTSLNRVPTFASFLVHPELLLSLLVKLLFPRRFFHVFVAQVFICRALRPTGSNLVRNAVATFSAFSGFGGN